MVSQGFLVEMALMVVPEKWVLKDLQDPKDLEGCLDLEGN
jgi:hypothetical protein